MTLIDGLKEYRFFKICSVDNKNVKDSGRYKTTLSPINVAQKVFKTLSKKYKKNKLTFCIKETTQGSLKKIYGPYLGEKSKNKQNKYNITIKLIKRQKGGQIAKEKCVSIKKLLKCIEKSKSLQISLYLFKLSRNKDETDKCCSLYKQDPVYKTLNCDKKKNECNISLNRVINKVKQEIKSINKNVNNYVNNYCIKIVASEEVKRKFNFNNKKISFYTLNQIFINNNDIVFIISDNPYKDAYDLLKKTVTSNEVSFNIYIKELIPKDNISKFDILQRTALYRNFPNVLKDNLNSIYN